MKVEVYSEMSFYADCPHCGAVNHIGVEGDSWNDGATMACEKCGKDFEIGEQP